MTFIIDIQRATDKELPNDEFIKQVISTVLAKFRKSSELSIRIVEDEEITALNHRYRNKNYPTNVLSFPVELPTGVVLEHELLGDVVIAANVVNKEAIAQNKSFVSHFTHMLIHGTLHLLGFDHINNKDAIVMENHEINIMKELNFPNPYTN